VRRLDAGDAPSDATIDRIEHAAGGPSPSGLVTPQQQPGGAAECAVDEGTSVPGGGAVVEPAELPGDATSRLQPSPSLEQLSSGEGDRSELHQELLACPSKAPCQFRFLVGREEGNLPDLVQVAPQELPPPPVLKRPCTASCCQFRVGQSHHLALLGRLRRIVVV
jgi:hypothetical protein